MTNVEEAWDQLAKRLEVVDGVPESAHRLFQHTTIRTEDMLWEILTRVASFLPSAIQVDRAASALKMWESLADLSRDVPFLRSLFGLRERPSSTPNGYQIKTSTEPDCVLEAARRLVDARRTDLIPGLRKQALRIIANCCADNNVNRALIIERHGIEHMILLADRREELNSLLPTLYNVCGDYDVVITGFDGAKLELDMMDNSDEKQDTVPLTIAEQELGKFNDKLEKTSMEVLLGLTGNVNASLHPLLADMIEWSSRPALFGIENSFASSDPDVLRPRMTKLFQALTLESPHYALDEEARASICQTYLNLLSQTSTRHFLSQSPSDLKAFISLPFKSDNPSGQSDPSRSAFLKIMYAISALPTYADNALPNSTFISDLARWLDEKHPQPITALVLLSNSLITIDRIIKFHNIYQLQPTLVEILSAHNDPLTILPTLSLCNRLALVSQGQVSLYSANLFSALSHLLIPNAQRQHNLEIHRETIALARSVVKSQPEHVMAILTKDLDLLRAIFATGSTTFDASSKLEAGRLMVELLRTLLSRSNIDTLDTAPPTSHLPAGMTAAAIRAVIFLLTDAPSSAIRAEGLFGLGLFSTLPRNTTESLDTRNTIIDTFYEQRATVLPILNEIVDISNLPSDPPGETPIEHSSSSGGERKAEIENLRYLLAQILSVPQTSPMGTGLSATSSDVKDEKDSFKGHLYDLAIRIGLSIDVSEPVLATA